MSEKQRFFGKYRGMVINNVDPMQTGRVMVQVPEVLGPALSTWAMPCIPYAGMQSGVYYFPPIGAGVWVEFEGGDADYPIWVGGFWGSAAEIPVLASAGPPGVQRFVVTTQLQTTLLVSDVPGPTGGFLFKSATGAMLMINETGITISNGQGAIISMVGPTVTINAGALTVT
jgi:uncharacterized protein involved in type VI secretion and phage assembly